MGVYTLKNTVQFYDWGDAEWIPSLLGRPNPEGRPMAELWMGAHPSAASEVVLSDGNMPLTELIEKDPEGVLGGKVAARFGGNFPFLFKVLAAGNPLSIQAHPDKKQAEEGFQRENDEGIPLDAYHRNYKDDNHKPELITAVTDFHAMRGFRSPAEISREFTGFFAGFDHPFYIPEAGGAEEAEEAEERELRRFFQSVLSASEADLERAISCLLAEIKKQGREGVLRYSWIEKLNQKYPGDAGVLCPLFLHVIRLKPGEGMFLPAGELHAYLHGLGIELMANSDNVLRGGCTSKHIAKNELMKVLRFSDGVPEILRPEPDSRGEAVYESKAEEFSLSLITVKSGRGYDAPDTGKAAILLCTEGSGTVRPQRGKSLQMRHGQSALITGDTGQYSIDGTGTFYKAAAG